MFPMIVTMVMAKREELFQRAGKSGSAGDVEIFVSSKKKWNFLHLFAVLGGG